MTLLLTDTCYPRTVIFLVIFPSHQGLLLVVYNVSQYILRVKLASGVSAPQKMMAVSNPVSDTIVRTLVSDIFPNGVGIISSGDSRKLGLPTVVMD